uniref:Ig-like domain-containing protein n=1 Tax=Denticeps clupeoides TaxID=299321 RepID=A0AAY4ETU2_9TELE
MAPGFLSHSFCAKSDRLFCPPGYGAERCFTVRARRNFQWVAEGSSLSLACDVEHCGRDDWSGGWGKLRGSVFAALNASSRLELHRRPLTANATRLHLNIISANQSDSGVYQCRINWPLGYSSSGHLTTVNVTEASLGGSTRPVSLRMLVYLCSALCFPLALGLAFCLCRKGAAPIPPHSSTTCKHHLCDSKPFRFNDWALVHCYNFMPY